MYKCMYDNVNDKKMVFRLLGQPNTLPVTEEKEKSPSLFICVVPCCYMNHPWPLFSCGDKTFVAFKLVTTLNSV